MRNLSIFALTLQILFFLTISPIQAGEDDNKAPITPPKQLEWGMGYLDVVDHFKSYKLEVKKLKKSKDKEVPKDYRMAEVKGKQEINDRKVWKAYLIFNTEQELVGSFNTLKWKNDEGSGGIVTKGDGAGRKDAWDYYFTMKAKIQSKYGNKTRDDALDFQNGEIPNKHSFKTMFEDIDHNKLILEIFRFKRLGLDDYFVQLVYKSNEWREALSEEENKGDEY